MSSIVVVILVGLIGSEHGTFEVAAAEIVGRTGSVIATAIPGHKYPDPGKVREKMCQGCAVSTPFPIFEYCQGLNMDSMQRAAAAALHEATREKLSRVFGELDKEKDILKRLYSEPSKDRAAIDQHEANVLLLAKKGWNILRESSSQMYELLTPEQRRNLDACLAQIPSRHQERLK